MTRLGLCCMFRDQPIKFVTTTATAIGKMNRPDALKKLSRLCMENADALLAAKKDRVARFIHASNPKNEWSSSRWQPQLFHYIPLKCDFCRDFAKVSLTQRSACDKNK